MDHFKGPLALFSKANSAGSPQGGDVGAEGLWVDLECPWVDNGVLLAAVPTLHTIHGALFVAASEQTQQTRTGGKENLCHSTQAIKHGKFRLWIPFVISGVIILFLRLLMPCLQEKGQQFLLCLP